MQVNNYKPTHLQKKSYKLKKKWTRVEWRYGDSMWERDRQRQPKRENAWWRIRFWNRLEMTFCKALPAMRAIFPMI